MKKVFDSFSFVCFVKMWEYGLFAMVSSDLCNSFSSTFLQDFNET